MDPGPSPSSSPPGGPVMSPVMSPVSPAPLDRSPPRREDVLTPSLSAVLRLSVSKMDLLYRLLSARRSFNYNLSS
ncbi:hypothetical protein EYF80_054741 [Liparis tanakae]|uniref:Uncharacterized protein n=1 Tax=Liparis tanakae TaxID=230148 RepID=A0A4Z2F2V3_9TELE|nr:hypothetical protein EYF80_054741 [Liparis tanakae]